MRYRCFNFGYDVGRILLVYIKLLIPDYGCVACMYVCVWGMSGGWWEKHKKRKMCRHLRSCRNTQVGLHPWDRALWRAKKSTEVQKILVKLGDRMHCCSSFTVKSRSQRPNSGVVSVVKYGGQGQSGQAIKLSDYALHDDVQTLNNPCSWQPVGVSKN